MWVSIPQYLGCDECPQATLRLLDHLSMALGVSLHTGDLAQRAEQWCCRAATLMQCNDELAGYVHDLESEYDDETRLHDAEAMDAPRPSSWCGRPRNSSRTAGAPPCNNRGCLVSI